MKLIKTFFNNSMVVIRKVFLISIISVIASALAAVLSAGTAYAESASTKKALDQLFKDIDRLKPVLTERASVTEDGYYLIRHGETLDGIIARVLPNLPLRKKILREAVVHANPHAFKRKNPNWMYANKRIKLPDSGDIHNVIFTRSNKKLNRKKTAREERKSWVHYP
jgi:hypothetical protein